MYNAKGENFSSEKHFCLGGDHLKLQENSDCLHIECEVVV